MAMRFQRVPCMVPHWLEVVGLPDICVHQAKLVIRDRTPALWCHPFQFHSFLVNLRDSTDSTEKHILASFLQKKMRSNSLSKLKHPVHCTYKGGRRLAAAAAVAHLNPIHCQRSLTTMWRAVAISLADIFIIRHGHGSLPPAGPIRNA